MSVPKKQIWQISTGVSDAVRQEIAKQIPAIRAYAERLTKCQS